MLTIYWIRKRRVTMDFKGIFDSGVEFAKEKMDMVTDFWDSLDDDKKKLCIGCAAAAVAVICLVSVAYAIGKAQGRRLALEEEDF